MTVCSHNTTKLLLLILAALAGFCCDVFRALTLQALRAAAWISKGSTPARWNYGAFTGVLRAFCRLGYKYISFVLPWLYGAVRAFKRRFIRSYHARPAKFYRVQLIRHASRGRLRYVNRGCPIYGTPLDVVLTLFAPPICCGRPKSSFFRGVCPILRNPGTQKPRQGDFLKVKKFYKPGKL